MTSTQRRRNAPVRAAVAAPAEPGDTVFRVKDGERFGIILEMEKRHEFPNGAKRDAYFVALYPDGKQAWISARTAQSALSKSP